MSLHTQSFMQCNLTNVSNNPDEGMNHVNGKIKWILWVLSFECVTAAKSDLHHTIFTSQLFTQAQTQTVILHAIAVFNKVYFHLISLVHILLSCHLLHPSHSHLSLSYCQNDFPHLNRRYNTSGSQGLFSHILIHIPHPIRSLLHSRLSHSHISLPFTSFSLFHISLSFTHSLTQSLQSIIEHICI